MKFAIVSSKQDKAGMNITSFLPDLIPIHYVDCKIVHAENIDKKDEIEDADFIIFTSKHVGKKPKMLSLHAPGNWKQADYGGKEGKICKTSGTVLKTLFQEMSKNLPSGWELTLEVTHHGPFIEKPCCFIEIGSNEEDWRKKEAGKALAIAIENAIKILNKQKIKYKTVIGIGGPHYCPSMTKIQLNSDIAISHIIPQYVFPITENMISQALKKTEEKVSFAIIDWKGLDSEERKQTIDLLNKINLEYKKTSEIEK